MIINLKNYFVISILILSASSMAQNNVFADGTNNFGILASSYINTSPGTSISGDVGYTTGPAVPATVSGSTHVADSVYQQAGTAQNTATSIANSQVCTTHLGTSVDLSLVHNGVYTPGVYCTTGAASIGSGGITLSGNGIYIFQINGALTTVVNSGMTLSYGAQASDISWVPTQATTLGANSNFAGIILDASGVTIGHGVSMTGKVLAFGGTVSTSADTISVPSNMMSDATNNNFSSLGTAGNFAVLGSSAVTNTGNTIVTGNLGLSPGTSVVGFPPGVVTGINHITDSSAAQARVDATTAYGALSNTACTTNEPLSADIGGKTLGPGVYCFPSSAAITGTLTLSGSGVYIFQIPSTLVAAAGPGSTSNMVLTNGASSSNVFWQVGSSATLGTGSVFKGTIIAYKSITATTGATVEGRLLALTGAVTLDANHVTMPSNTMSDIAPGNFGILASSYINTSPGTSISGDVGYVTGPAVPASVSGSTHVADYVYQQAGTAQSDATSFAHSRVCTTNLGTTVDLSLVHGGLYTPGVYCTTGAASIGSGGITLSGNGIYIFQINGALTTVVNSNVMLTNGAQSSGVSWVPTQATTLGANSNFAGIILDASGVTIGHNVSMNGRVWAFGGTVSTDIDTITVSSYALADAVSGNFQCTVTFPTGAIDLGSNVQYPDKTYPPGVYCIDGAANIGSGPITLSGSGVHIFKISGALNQAVNTDVILSNGALSSGVIWVPAGPTIIGANSHLIGTVNGAPITIGANSDINGIGPAKTMADAVSGNFQCTVTFPIGTTDLGSNVQYPDKTYPPGVYCIDGAANIGSGPITLTGNGAHIFKINGALNQAANTDVILASGAQGSSIIWVPTGPTTIGANSHLIGTVNGAPITIGANSDINGIGPAKIMSDAVSGNFGILASTYTNTLPGTSIAGDLGYTRGPQVASAVSGVIHADDSIYSQAGIAQTAATAFSNSQACTVNLSGIAVDLSQAQGGVYTPGVYCTTGAASIGASGITLSGDGIYIFQIDGALTTVATSNVALTNGAKASIVFWVPTAATTLGANTQFAGTILDASGITISNDVNILGKALAFGGTVSTSADTITVPLFELADAVSGDFPCTVTFPTGTIDLGSNVRYPDKVYPPGVYCIDGIANIGSGPITLTGNGNHIFKISGALNQAANTDVILSNGALSSGVIWIPTGPITIGANSNLIGTVSGAPITIGANSDINGVGPKIMADAVSGNFGILASTYTNTSPGTSIAGDLGYTTGSARPATVDGVIHKADSVYSQAGTAQNTAISFANSQVCTTNLGTTVNLSLVHGGVYTPGVYCITGAASIGASGITLSGDGIYIFKINGALTTVANSIVNLDGAQASNISWVPTAATTLGANTKFAGIILDASGVTMSNNVMMTGRVLAFGGTVSTNADTITVPSYAMADTTSGNLPCTVTFPTGAIDLGSNVQYPDKVYPPGVYCIDGAANIGSGPITLTGNGAHIFKINGALNQAANTDVILVDGAQVSSVIWVPTGPTIIGANSHLIGTVNGAPITIGANSDINGIGPAKTMADSMSPPLYATGDTTVPEFGAIAAMILVIGIVSIIAISARTGLRLVPKY